MRILYGNRILFMFQFLIGRLQTLVRILDMVYHDMFQFLIGRLQTRQLRPLASVLKRVSIPHRQATNESKFQVLLVSHAVSIPHRQATNGCWHGRECAGGNKFQFLIGRLQTNFISPPSIFHRSGFNSSQVGYKLDLSQNTRGGIQLFQFLIGRLQTKGDPYRPPDHRDVSIPHRQATNDA